MDNNSRDDDTYGNLQTVIHGRESSSNTRTARHRETRPLGCSGARVTVLGMGGASLGDLYVKITNEGAIEAVRAAHAAGVGLFDTAPWYGVGLSESRMGLALHDKPRSSFHFNTKVGRFLRPDRRAKNGTDVGWIGGFHMNVEYCYGGDAFQRQVEDSLQRTGLGYIDSLVIHDLEPTVHIIQGVTDGVQEALVHLKVLEASGFPRLQQMRRDGIVKAFGAGMNSNEAGEDVEKKRAWNRDYTAALIKMGHDSGEPPIDFLLLANMWSLLNFEALEDGILDKCLEAGISVIVGGPYSSGILATGADPSSGSVPKYNYEPASPEVRARCRKIEGICASHGVALIAAAIQFPLRHPAVTSVIPGAKSVLEVNSNVDNMNVDIPDALWEELEREKLIPHI